MRPRAAPSPHPRASAATPPAAVPAGSPRVGRMLTITALWGACFVTIRWGLRDAPALWYAALRGLVAGAVLAGYAALRPNRLPRLGLRGAVTMSALALANVTLAFGAMFVATEGTVTGIAAVLSNAQPLLIVLPAWVLYGERADAQTVAFMGLGLIGILVLAGGGGSGALLALLAAIGITAGTLLIRQLDGLDLVVVSAAHFLLGGAVLVGLAALLEGPPAIAWTPRFVASLAFLALLGTAVAFVLWFEEARRAPLAAVSMWTLLVPVFGVAFGAVLLGERLAARELVGVVTVVLGVAAVQARQQWQSRRAAVPSG